MAKQLCFFWFDTSKHKFDFYIGLKTGEVDNRIKMLKLPKNITRNPRSITERKNWKANEWRTYLLYYSLGVLYKILPMKYLRHFGQFINCIWILIQSEISPNEVNALKPTVNIFVRQYVEMYGEKHATYNLHTILHLPKCVEDLGPLWAYSNFPFENNNGKLQRFVKSPKGVLSQILNKYAWTSYLDNTEFGQTVNDFRNKIFKSNLTSLIHNRVLGGQVKIILNNLNDLNGFNLEFENRNFFSFKRVIQNGVEYSTKTYSCNVKNNDSVIKLNDNSFGEIVHILVQNQQIFVVADIFEIDSHHELTKICSHVKVIKKKKSKSIIIPVNFISYKCVFVETEIVSYLIKYIDFIDKD